MLVFKIRTEIGKDSDYGKNFICFYHCPCRFLDAKRERISLTLYYIAKWWYYDIMRFFQADSTCSHAGTPWYCQPEKFSWYRHIIILWYSKGSGYMCRTYDGFPPNYPGGPGQYQTSNNLTSWSDTMAGYSANLFGIFMHNIFCCELVIHIAVGCLFHFFKYLLTYLQFSTYYL